MTSHFGDPKSRLKPFLGMHAETLAIHGGQHPDPVTGAVMPPIYQTSTYAQKSPGQPIGEFEYSRTHNPTRRMLEDCLALLEGGTYGLATSTGMSAMLLVTSLLKAGDEVLCCDDVYGGTYRMFTKVSNHQGLNFKFLELSEAGAVERLEKAASPNTKMVWLETPTNPLLKLLDIKAIAALCKSKGWLLVVDNTFMSPIFQTPLKLGADIVVHSMTKYIGGHSDLVAGSVITARDDLADKLYFLQNSMGLVCGPFDAWLLLRSIKTLALRMKAHENAATEIAKFLSSHPKIDRVIYPGLASHPQHALAKSQMLGFGGMLRCYLKGGLAEAQKMLERVKLFTLAESLGGVESLIEHPAIMTHASIPADIRAKNGISDSFVRLSIGLENIDDLKRDLDQALT